MLPEEKKKLVSNQSIYFIHGQNRFLFILNLSGLGNVNIKNKNNQFLQISLGVGWNPL